MSNLLIRTFIKNHTNTADPNVRRSYGSLAGFTGIMCNILLFIFKLITGVATGHISIMADAFNNLSDMAVSVVTLAGFRLSGKPADRQHPYGHGRSEYIAGQVVSFAIMFVGVSLLKSSVEKIIAPEATTFTLLTVVVLAASVAVKMWMYTFYTKAGKCIGSPSLIAAAKDSRNDAIATSAVLISAIIEHTTGVMTDGWTGAGVAAFIIISGIMSCKKTLEPLLGQMPSKEVTDKINSLALSVPGIMGVHDLTVHDYGPGRMYCTLHAEIPAKLGFTEAHRIVHGAERRIHEEIGCEVSIHMDPIEEYDPETERLKGITEKIVKTINEEFKIHDFRVIQNKPGVVVSFDVVVPDDHKEDPEELKKKIGRSLQMWEPGCAAQITVDRLFVRE